jgi:hypothetical protein
MHSTIVTSCFMFGSAARRRCHHGSSSKHVRCHDFEHHQATGRPDEIDVFIH